MPPQPLSFVARNANVIFDPDEAFRLNPNLAAYIPKIIASWTQVEGGISDLIRVLLPTANISQTAKTKGAAVTLAIFDAIDSPTIRLAALRAGASAILEGKYLLIFQAVLDCLKGPSRDRNKLAHWDWGFTFDVPESLLLKNPKTRNSSYDDIFVYRENDFKEILNGISQLNGWLHSVHFTSIEGHPSRDRVYDELVAEPQIARALSKRQSDRQ